MEDEILQAYEKIITDEEDEKEVWEVLLIVENNILRIARADEIINPKKWHYYQTDKTNKYTLWNLDVESAKPLAKSILNQLWLFPELFMLKMLLWITGGILCIAVVISLLSFNTFKQKDALTMFTSISEGIHKLETLQPQKKAVIDENF